MADEEEPEPSAQTEESDYEIPGIPDESRSTVNASKTASKISKLQSLVSTILQNGSPSASQVVPPLERSAAPSKIPSAVPSKTPSTVPSRTPSAVPSKTPSAVPSKTSARTSKQSTEEAKSKESQEEKSQDLSVKSSLDQLSKDMSQYCPKPRMHRHCQRRFRELIGKREMKKEELTKQQCVLKQRLEILECSMPAVMVWNIWRMSQGACVPNLKQVLEKQFQGPASGEVYCPSTPSRHFDCRVREVEAERKQAQKRVEEARALWAEKEAALEEKSKRLEEARRTQMQIKENIENLKIEAQRLREAASKATEDGACEAGECRVIECKKKWLEKVPSGASIKSTDIECLEELQNLAQTELCMKRQIAELERREEAYMRTLQQADELWAKLQCDATSTMSTLQDQLDVKTAANQEMADRIVQLEDVLEELRSRLATCRSHLEKFMSIDKIEALIGRDSDFAGVFDRDTLAKPDMDDAESEIKPDVGDAGQGISPEDFELEKQKVDEAMDYLASYGSLSELFVDDDYVCAPDFVCNDVVLTESGLTEEEMAALKEGRITAEMLLQKIQGADAQVAAASQMRMIKQEREESVKEADEEAEGEAADDWEADEMTLRSDRIVDDEQITVSELGEMEIDAMQESSFMEEASLMEETSYVGEASVAEEASYVGEASVAEEALVDAQEPSEASESEIAEQSIKTEPEDYVSVEEGAILVPLDELLTWQDNVDTIRETVAKCPDCVVVKNNADVMAEEISRYTGREVREVIEERKPVFEEADIEAEIPLQAVEEVSIKEEVKDFEDFIEEPKEVEAEAAVTDVGKEPSRPLVSEVPSAEDGVPATELTPTAVSEAPVAEERVKEADVESIADVPAIVKERSIAIEGIEAPVAEVPKEPVAAESAAERVEVPDKVTPLEPTVGEREGERREDVTKEKEVDEIITERKEETRSQIPEKGEEAVTAERKEIEVDLLPEKEPTPKETVEVVLDEEGKEVEKEVVELREEVPVPAEEKVVVESALEKTEEVIEEAVIESDLVEEREEIIMDEEAAAEVTEREEAAVESVAEKEEEVVEAEKEEVVEAEKEEETVEAEKEEVVEAEKEEEAVEAEKEEEAVEAEKEEEVEAEKEEEVEAEKEEAVEAEKEEEVMESVPEEVEEEAVMEPVPEEEEEVPTEEVPTEEAPAEVAPEEEKEPELIPEEVEPEPTEEGEEEIPTDEVEKVVILSVEVLPEAEKELEEEEVAEEEMLPEAMLPEEVEVEVLPEEEEPAEEPAVSEVEVTIEVQVEEVCVLKRPEEAVSEESISEVCVCVPLEPEESETEVPEDTFGLPCVCSDTSAKPISEVQEKILEVPCVCCTMREEAPKETKATVTEEICELPCTCFAMPREIHDGTCDCGIRDEATVSQTVAEIRKLPSVRSHKSGVSKATEPSKLPSVRSYKSGVSKASGVEETCKLPSDRSSKSGVSKASGAEETCKLPSDRSSKSGVSKASGLEEKLPCVCSSIPEESTPDPEQSKPCVCSSKAETPVAPVEDPHFIYSIPVVGGGHLHEPSTKIEVTQTEFSTRTFETMQVVTQTVSDTGTQTPMNRLLRRTQNPKIIAVTTPVDPEMEILSQLSHRLKPMTQATLVTTTASSQTENTGVYQSTSVSRKASPSLRISEILQSLRAGVAHLKSGPEEELKTINYGRKTQDPLGPKCNCCVCGKDMPADTRTRTSKPSSTVFRFQTPSRKTVPGVDQGVQYDTICPKCKIIKLQESLRSRECIKTTKKESLRSTCDRQVCASVASFEPKGIPFNRLKKKVDQSVTAKIPKSVKRERPSKAPEKEVQEIMPAAKPADKESVMHCMCEMADECGTERPRCACGDPD